MTAGQIDTKAFEFLTGFEGTHIFGSGLDILETTEHTTRYREDLARLASDGIKAFRCCIPWHRVERIKGNYDWAWLDEYLACVRDHGLNPIVDPLHHTSFPDWLADGFKDERFVDSYHQFVVAFARRYPWVTHYTLINEPFVTAWLCGYCGIWHPRHRGYKRFVPMLLNMARVICELCESLSGIVRDFQFVHIDSCEWHCAVDDAARPRAERGNALRFIVLDLILGRMDGAHPLYRLLARHGMSDACAAWFQEHATRIDVLGLDYYAHSELGWAGRARSEDFIARGFCSVAMDYAARYSLPIMLAETNFCGSVSDRISWLGYMVKQCEMLAPLLAAQGLSFTGFCWYPYVDSTDWCSLVRKARRRIDPQGIYSLDASFERHGSELSGIYAALVKKSIGSDDISFYGFGNEVLDLRRVRKFLR